jgi:hypothetical protein
MKIKIRIKQCLILLPVLLAACKSSRIQEQPLRQELSANAAGKGPAVYLDFKKGPSHNHPSFVLWAEDMDGNFIQTLFITRTMGTGIYEHGDPSSGHWEAGELRRPASLPYWSHRRGIRAPDGLYIPSASNPVPDAYTGATPGADFGITVRFDSDPPPEFRLYFEINQTWDWNEYWTNDRYPDDEEYKTSCQPALVYRCTVDLNRKDQEYTMEVIGYSHYSGRTGELFTELGTITTALNIVGSLRIRIIL